MLRVLLVSGITIWLLGSAFLLFPVFRLPGFMPRAAMTLLCAELLALLVTHYAPPASLAGETAWTLASQDVPALAALLYALAIAFGIRAHRRPGVTTRSR